MGRLASAAHIRNIGATPQGGGVTPRPSPSLLFTRPADQNCYSGNKPKADQSAESRSRGRPVPKSRSLKSMRPESPKI